MPYTIKELRDRYTEHSKQASELTRTLAISGIAAVWVFAERDGAVYKLDAYSIVAGAFFCVGLLVDLLHYVIGTVMYGRFVGGKGPTAEASIPNRISRTMWAAWWAKVLLVLTGLGVLAYGLAHRVIAG